MKIVYILTLTFLATASYALEVDSFTYRYNPLEDSLEKADDFLNRELKNAINEANKANELFSSPCSENTLRRKIKKKLVAGPKGIFVTAPLQKFIDKGRLGEGFVTKTKKSESIYQYVPLIYKPFLKITPYSPLIKTNNTLIGSDKFSHFFNVGYLFYRRHIKHKQSVKEILRNGKTSERITWGGFFNGIISYGDLIANFQGMRFFMYLFGEGIDPLTDVNYQGQGPIKCQDGKFKLVEVLSFSDFIDDGMDEGINCNDYTSRLMKKSINKHLEKIGMECPVERDRCEALGDKYSKYAKYLLHKDCR